MFRIEMFPAREGDCLIVTYGEGGSPKRILIDGGRKATYADLQGYLANLPPGERQFELLIVSHVDRDHIEGVLEMLTDPALPVSFKDVWFNGYHNLHDGDFEVFSAVQGEVLTAEIVKRVHHHQWRWNGAFGESYTKAAALPSDGTLLNIPLDGGMVLTVLSPSRAKMTALIPRWEAECRAAGMIAGAAAQEPPPEGYEYFNAIDIDTLAEEPFEADPSTPNGSSIAVLAQYGGKKALLSGDAHADLLAGSIAHMRNADAPLEIDLFKLSHHGSRRNITTTLLQSLRCKHYLVSTNGSYFNHPDPIAMSRLIKYGGPDKHIWFNYTCNETILWDVPSWKQDWNYTLHFPASGANGFQRVELA